MDKNSVIGLFLIGFLIIAYSVYTQPTEQERLASQHTADSIAAINKTIVQEQTAREKSTVAVASPLAETMLSDSVKKEIALQEFGNFSDGAAGKEEFYTVENDLMKVSISSKGAIIKSVELKKYKTHDGEPVRLMSGDSSTFNLSFPAQNRSINSTDLYFTTQGIVAKGVAKVISFRLTAGTGKYIEYNYSLTDGSYLVGFHIDLVNLNDVIAPNATYLAFDWRENVIQQEQSIANERAATTIYYHFMDDEVDKISPADAEEQSLKTKVKWMAFKQQFFTSVLIADNSFDSPVVETKMDEGQTKYVKSLTASFALPYDHKASESYGMKFYFGPNHYQTLKKIDALGLEKQIDLG